MNTKATTLVAFFSLLSRRLGNIPVQKHTLFASSQGHTLFYFILFCLQLAAVDILKFALELKRHRLYGIETDRSLKHTHSYNNTLE